MRMGNVTRTIILTLCVLSMAAVLPFSAFAQSKAKTYSWKHVGLGPLGSETERILAEPFQKGVEELSGGNMKIKLYGSGQLGSAGENMDMVGKGIADFGCMVTSFAGEKIPLATAMDLPMMGLHPKQRVALISNFWKTYKGLLEYQDRYNIVVLWINPGENGDLQANKPIIKPEDIKGMKMRSLGGATTYMLKALGAVPIQMAPGEVYQALQTGVIDGAVAAIRFQADFKWQEVASNFTVMAEPLIGTGTFTCVNKKLWNSLSAEEKDIIQKAGVKAQAHAVQIAIDMPKIGAQRMVDQGKKVAYLDQAQTDAFKAPLKASWDLWLKDNPQGKDFIEQCQSWLDKNPVEKFK
jgi:TRAP-type transport system periplasmic protein